MKNYQKDNLNIIGRIMIQLAQFLAALNNLVRSGVIKKVPDAIKFAEQQFGKVTPLLKKQIERVFENIKKPVVGKPGKKEGAVIPMVKEGAKKAEGIETLEEGSPLMDRLDKKVEDVRQDFVNPKRPGGSLDPATGITRALARRILDRKGIEIGKKDPIDVFTDTFGEAISDVNNLAEEMIEIDSRGGGMKDMDQMLEADGLFDIEIPTNPQKGLTDDEMIDMLEKDLKEKETLEDFDPTDREPNAKGGLTRTSYAMGKGPVLPSDEDPINPFGPKPTGPVLPDKSMMASYGYDDAMGESFAEFLRLKKIGEIPMDMEFDEYLDQLDIDIPYGKKQKQAPSIKLASGFESFKDFVESTGDGELMELYSEFLETGDDARMMLRLKKLGYDMRDDIATGGRVQAASGGLAEILKL
jgi:hypothetical protein